MEILTNFKALAMVFLFFGASIFVHELGHFLAARWRGLKVTRFSIGFGPKIFSWTRNGVEYILAALPLGGYVALPQLGHMEIIEGEAEETESPPISWTSKVIVLVAGAFFNILFALALGFWLFQLGGRPEPIYYDVTELGPISETIYISEEESVPNPAHQAGLQRGDKVISIDGKPVSLWKHIAKRIVFGTNRAEDGKPLSIFEVQRGNEILKFNVNPVIGGPERMRMVGVSPEFPENLPALIEGVYEGFPADKASILPGDEIIGFNGEPVVSRNQISTFILANPETTIDLEIDRDGEAIRTTLTPQMAVVRQGTDPIPMIGVAWGLPDKLIKETPTVLVKSAVSETLETLQKLINPKSDIRLSHMSGPVGMGNIIYKTAKRDFRWVLFIVIIINVNLAIINLLPIPVLDGGHITFATIEKLRGRALPENVMMSLQGLFVILLLSLMLYVTVFDGKRIFREREDEKAADSANALRPQLVEEKETTDDQP